MESKSGEITVHITEETDQWNRIALALSRDKRRPISTLTAILGVSALLDAYENETKRLIAADNAVSK